MFPNVLLFCGLTLQVYFVSSQRTNHFSRYPSDGYFPSVFEGLRSRSRSHCAALCLERAGCVSIAVHSPVNQGGDDMTNCRTSRGEGDFVMDTEWQTYVLSACSDDDEAACHVWSNQDTTTAEVPPTTTVRRTCPADFEVLGEGCYKYHDELKTWSEAEAMCESETGHLVIITSTIEQTLVSYRGLRRGSGFQFYGGGQFNPAAGVWQTGDGQPLVYTYWNDGPPSGSSPMCLLVSAYPEKWSSDNCDVGHEYMCEIDLV